MMFHFRKRPNDAKKTKHKKLRAVSHEELRSKPEEPPMQKLPYLVELNPGQSLSHPHPHHYQDFSSFWCLALDNMD